MLCNVNLNSQTSYDLKNSAARSEIDSLAGLCTTDSLIPIPGTGFLPVRSIKSNSFEGYGIVGTDSIGRLVRKWESYTKVPDWFL